MSRRRRARVRKRPERGERRRRRDGDGAKDVVSVDAGASVDEGGGDGARPADGASPKRGASPGGETGGRAAGSRRARRRGVRGVAGGATSGSRFENAETNERAPGAPASSSSSLPPLDLGDPEKYRRLRETLGVEAALRAPLSRLLAPLEAAAKDENRRGARGTPTCSSRWRCRGAPVAVRAPRGVRAAEAPRDPTGGRERGVRDARRGRRRRAAIAYKRRDA